MTDRVDQVGAAIVAQLQAASAPIKAVEIRAAIGCSASDFSQAVRRLRWRGMLEFGSMTLTSSMRGPSPDATPASNLQEERTAPSQGAAIEGAAANSAPAAGGALARHDSAPPAECDRLGPEIAAELLAECEAFLAENPMPPSTFGKLACGQTMLLTTLKNAKQGPQRRTVRRVRAFMDSWRIRAGELRARGGVPGSQNCQMRTAALVVSAEQREAEAEQRRQVEAGRANRRPGETLADAVKREALEEGERRAQARAAGGGVHPIDLAKSCAHHPKARKFEPLPAQIWAELKSLAEELGEPAAELLPRAVEQGIAAIRREA